jgi:trehalose 6-phosphate phosphatase
LQDLAAYLDGLGLTLSGSHGLELRLPGGPITLDDAADPSLLDDAFEALFPLARERGLLLERKPGAVALHFRSDPAAETRCRDAVTRVAATQGLRAVHGDMVSEAALAGIDKGHALAGLMGRTPFAGRIPVMVGDDTTDEDGFAAAQAMGGFGIRIGEVETVARYRVATRDIVMQWLADTLDRAAR